MTFKIGFVDGTSWTSAIMCVSIALIAAVIIYNNKITCALLAVFYIVCKANGWDDWIFYVVATLVFLLTLIYKYDKHKKLKLPQTESKSKR